MHKIRDFDRFRRNTSIIYSPIFPGFKFITTASIFIKAKDVKKPTSTIVEDLPLADVKLGTTPSHLAVSADDLTLAVCIIKNNNAYALMYDIRSVGAKVKNCMVKQLYSTVNYKELLITARVNVMFSYCLSVCPFRL